MEHKPFRTPLNELRRQNLTESDVRNFRQNCVEEYALILTRFDSIRL